MKISLRVFLILMVACCFNMSMAFNPVGHSRIPVSFGVGYAWSQVDYSSTVSGTHGDSEIESYPYTYHSINFIAQVALHKFVSLKGYYSVPVTGAALDVSESGYYAPDGYLYAPSPNSAIALVFHVDMKGVDLLLESGYTFDLETDIETTNESSDIQQSISSGYMLRAEASDTLGFQKIRPYFALRMDFYTVHGEFKPNNPSIFDTNKFEEPAAQMKLEAGVYF